MFANEAADMVTISWLSTRESSRNRASSAASRANLELTRNRPTSPPARCSPITKTSIALLTSAPLCYRFAGHLASCPGTAPLGTVHAAMTDVMLRTCEMPWKHQDYCVIIASNPILPSRSSDSIINFLEPPECGCVAGQLRNSSSRGIYLASNSL